MSKEMYSLVFDIIDFLAPWKSKTPKKKKKNLMREMQENYCLVLFMFARQLYFYVLGPISLLGY